MGKIYPFQLCDSCRKIRPVMNDGSLGYSIEEWLDSPGYKDNPISYAMMNPIALSWLKANGGCSKCIALFKEN